MEYLTILALVMPDLHILPQDKGKDFKEMCWRKYTRAVMINNVTEELFMLRREDVCRLMEDEYAIIKNMRSIDGIQRPIFDSDDNEYSIVYESYMRNDKSIDLRYLISQGEKECRVAEISISPYCEFDLNTFDANQLMIFAKTESDIDSIMMDVDLNVSVKISDKSERYATARQSLALMGINYIRINEYGEAFIEPKGELYFDRIIIPEGVECLSGSDETGFVQIIDIKELVLPKSCRRIQRKALLHMRIEVLYLGGTEVIEDYEFTQCDLLSIQETSNLKYVGKMSTLIGSRIVDSLRHLKPIHSTDGRGSTICFQLER